jgi:hypothetical protein
MDLIAAAKGAQATPQAPVAASPAGAPAQPQPQGGNPLAALAAQAAPQQQPAPAPTHAQAVAAMHRFGQIKSAMAPVIADPNLGKTNVRPKLLDAASKLLGSKVLSLPEIMNSIKNLPDDPIQQKKFVENIMNTATQAQLTVLQQHRNAQLPEDQEPDEWTPDNHADNMAGLMAHYQGAAK